MKALTIYQPWASLIMAGAKPYEFRTWDYRSRASALVDQRIIIHAGSRKVVTAEIADLMHRLSFGGKGTGLNVAPAMDLLDGWWRKGKGATLPLGAGLGTAILRVPRKASALFVGDVADSDRIDQHVWAWPLTEIEVFEPIIPARGAQGFWNWSP